MERRSLGSSGLSVSVIGLGTVKIGRNQGVKYPRPFELPDDAAVGRLLGQARELGINLLDTAPAYGCSEERLGRLRPGPRSDWVILTKVGESFENGRSSFDFSAQATRDSLERSLRRLRTDYLDAVLIHSNGQDLAILEQTAVLDTLNRCKEAGWIRAQGISTKTLEGALRAVEVCDLVMLSYNQDHIGERPAIQVAHEAGKGVLIKKALSSGHLSGPEAAGRALRFALEPPGVGSVILGTINPTHLAENVAAVSSIGRE